MLLSARSVNAIRTATYWEIGRRIVKSEQQGKKRAVYGEALLEKLAADLTARFGRGFGALETSDRCASFFLLGQKSKYGRHCLPNLKEVHLPPP